jgi:hypothetical protein
MPPNDLRKRIESRERRGRGLIKRVNFENAEPANPSKYTVISPDAVALPLSLILRPATMPV